MIIARLQGGLGNQLFQYAAAKALAIRLGTTFKLDTITSLKQDRLRQVALQDLHATIDTATLKEINQFVYFPRLYRHHPVIFSSLGRNIYREAHFHFDELFFHLKDPVFIDGFWQSPLYFNHIAPVISADFRIKPHLITSVMAKGTELANRESIAVHVRRGDFLNPKAAAYHGVLGTDYYTRAISQIRSKKPGASIHYFSDDIKWVQQNLPAENAEYVSASTKSAIEDFYLMTKCRHNIIANSSFSWWTAWLNANPGKMVVAPQKWFAVENVKTKDLIPADWTRM